jgi:hypothetical protein
MLYTQLNRLDQENSLIPSHRSKNASTARVGILNDLLQNTIGEAAKPAHPDLASSSRAKDASMDARRLSFGGDNERTSSEWGISGEDLVFEIGSVSEMAFGCTAEFTLTNNSENDGAFMVSFNRAARGAMCTTSTPDS